ncbi:deoxyribose-phosphate aldolase superfamily [Treponema primitia ZAS-2]|uniref:Deoxyribose-phosphate aldolase superfamily n=1 Tax=Treponema primitia (strain ATCC BAA-887 / DSM 12427 / ZAS-2) TaxID=545694 RepID=F5YPQ9_TREPZ|nr:3-hydroxy-5-phosphonooxypentane-2,4-dione thiolase [Treponema primitia]AEF83614.1 deoxyribose-phosphate aldolase superfamily [Treponema primitia ZAS-2]
MADLDGIKVDKNYHLDKEFATDGNFHVKGAANLDWGMKKRLTNIFNPKSGNTVMFAFDHGYFMGSVSGLERLDILIPQLIDHVDVLMATRGALRTSVKPGFRKGVALRVSSGSSMLNDDLSHEIVAVDIEDAIRLDVDCLAVQVFIGAEGQLESIDNLSRVINAGNRYSIPTLGVVAVGKDMERTDQYFKLATRILAEMGVSIVKTYYCDKFEEVVAACPVPIVVAGGKKLPEKEALEMAYNSMQGGARGLDMGRNIFQSYHPSQMADAIGKIVHEKFTAKEAWDYYSQAIR